MKKKIILSVMVLFSLIAIQSCGGKKAEEKKYDAKTDQVDNGVYYCPMKCEGDKTYDKPGQCPVCKMDLELVKGEHVHSDTTHVH